MQAPKRSWPRAKSFASVPVLLALAGLSLMSVTALANPVVVYGSSGTSEKVDGSRGGGGDETDEYAQPGDYVQCDENSPKLRLCRWVGGCLLKTFCKLENRENRF